MAQPQGLVRDFPGVLRRPRKCAVVQCRKSQPLWKAFVSCLSGPALQSGTRFGKLHQGQCCRRFGMSIKIRVAALVLSAAFVTEGSFAADRCVSREDADTLKVAALQQQLMVAALTCHEVR